MGSILHWLGVFLVVWAVKPWWLAAVFATGEAGRFALDKAGLARPERIADHY